MRRKDGREQISVGVFCGSREVEEYDLTASAEEVGELIAGYGYRLVFGGGNTGLMSAVSQSAVDFYAPVVGIIPKFLSSVEKPADNLTELIYVDTMVERKERMFLESDMFLVLPGGVGTLDEAFEVITNNQLGLFRKPIGFFDVDGYYQKIHEFFETAIDCGLISDTVNDLCFFDSNIKALFEKLIGALPD